MKRRFFLILCGYTAFAASLERSSELRFCLHAEPKTFDPMLVDDDASETIRFLTGGVLIRINRRTQELQPELAVSWKIENGGRSISFRLRQGILFSDGKPFTAEDVAHTFRALMDPKLHAPTADPFRSDDGTPQVKVTKPDHVQIIFPAPVSGLERLFDQVAILSSRSAAKDGPVLGPFVVASYRPGSEVLLKRNPHYWKRDAAGRPLPYVESIRLYIQQNREFEMVRFRRGELDLIDAMSPDAFEQLSRQMPDAVRDLGPSLESEMMWFNQVASAPIPAYKKTWFRSTNFRRAISAAINRADLCRLAYRGHATPASGSISPANQFWFNSRLAPHPYNPADALQRLRADGFRLQNGALVDRDGHAVEFSLITNAGNTAREKIAALMQQDLRAIGIKLNVVTLDFRSLIERIGQTFQYEASLLGLTNLDLDPSSQMNVWMSSASNHQWNPNQKSPETAWEAEIDRLMRMQASLIDRQKRKACFDQVQQIVSEQAPFLYLVTKNSLTAVSPAVRNAAPGVLRPQTYWNVESLMLAQIR
jgi:peptide/nickel transport system substrate-binding protein